MTNTPTTKRKAGAQIKLAELSSTDVLKLAAVVQEPLDMLLAKNKYKSSVIDRRVYWWILGKMAALQTANKDEKMKVPDENLVFKIPVSALYPQQIGDVEEPDRKKWIRGQLTNKATYSNFKEIAKKLIERSIVTVDHMDLVDPTLRKVGAIAIFPRVFYENGLLEVHVDRFIVPSICTLSKGYIKFQRKSAMRLGHEYSQILYVRLCRFLDKRQWRVSIDDLRTILEAKSYVRYSNFKQKVLIPAIQEINEKTDIQVELLEVATAGKKVVEIYFKMSSRGDKDNFNIKALRNEAEVTTNHIYKLDIELRRERAKIILKEEYTFTDRQEEIIVSNETILNKFIELHTKIEIGLINVKTSATKYVAHVLFSKPSTDSSPTLFQM